MKIKFIAPVSVADAETGELVNYDDGLRHFSGTAVKLDPLSKHIATDLSEQGGISGGYIEITWPKKGKVNIVTTYDSPRQLTERELELLRSQTENQWWNGVGRELAAQWKETHKVVASFAPVDAKQKTIVLHQILPPTPIHSEFFSDGKLVYCGIKPIRGSDAASFEILSENYSRDSKRVYGVQGSLPLKKVRRLSEFRVLNELFATDGEIVCYCEGAYLEEADAATFEVLDPGYDDGKGCGGGRGYARDKKFIWHYVNTVGKPAKIFDADRATFHSIGYGYAIDANHVYYEKHLLKGANPETWRRLNECYSCDQDRVYYQQKLIRDADAESFSCVQFPFFDWLGWDRNQCYIGGEPVDERQFFSAVRDKAFFIGKVESYQDDPTARFRASLKVRVAEWLYRPDLKIVSPNIDDVIDVTDCVPWIPRLEYRGMDMVIALQRRFAQTVGKACVFFALKSNESNPFAVSLLSWSDSPVDAQSLRNLIAIMKSKGRGLAEVC